MATFAPRADARRAVSAPMPRAAPVKKIVLPAMLTPRTLSARALGRSLQLRADLLVDQLYELRAEVVGALEGLGLDRLGRVAGLVVVARVAELVRAPDRECRVARHPRAERVGRDARHDGTGLVVALVLVAQLVADGDQVRVERVGQDVALLGGVLDRA